MVRQKDEKQIKEGMRQQKKVIRSNKGEIKIPLPQKRKGKKFEDEMSFQNS